ncbi:MAG: transglycosylase SLT domain-containing protein [bacterium]
MKHNLLIKYFIFTIIIITLFLDHHNLSLTADQPRHTIIKEAVLTNVTSSYKELAKEYTTPWLFSERVVVNTPLPIVKNDDDSEKTKLRLDHLDKKAKKFLSIAMEQGSRFKVNPQLIMAIMQTESSFNPWARSSSGAVGLMQLIPRHGAKEAYRYVYDKNKTPSRNYLYNPENNVQLGAAYLSLLQNKHFGRIKDTLKNNYLTICAYNWGPTALHKKILNKYDIERINSKELYTLLIKKAPRETRDYLQKVIDRMKIYESIVG